MTIATTTPAGGSAALTVAGMIDTNSSNSVGFRLRRNGTVIGQITTPSSQLAMQDVIGNGINFLNSSSVSTLFLSNSGSVGIGTTTPWGKLSITASGTGTGKAFVVADSNNNSKFVIQDNGNVGIGTTTPFWALTVASSSGPQLALVDTSDGTFAWTLRSKNNALYISTSTASATSSVAALTFDGTTGAAIFGSSGTSTFVGGLQALSLNVTTGTSTFANGINLAAGCFSVGGTCMGGSALSGGTTGMLSAWSSASTLTATSGPTASWFIATSTTVASTFAASVGIGTSTPWARLSVLAADNVSAPQFFVGSSTATSLFVSSAGNVGIGTNSPTQKLDIAGFVNVDQASGYRQAGSTVLFASTSNATLAVGAVNAASWMSASSSIWQSVAIGALALNTTPTTGAAIRNTAAGYQAMQLNTAGYSNSAFGVASLRSNTTGYQNTAIGDSAAFSNITGLSNTAVGMQSLLFNRAATNTVAIGVNAARGGTTYSNQGITAIGTGAGYNFLTGSDYNTLLGYQAGYDITTGANNTIIGPFVTTGAGITTGSNNILIGQGVRVGLDQTASNQLNIGNLLFGTSLGTNATVSQGRLGIGTSTPGTTLDVWGPIRFRDYVAGGLPVAGTSGALIRVSDSVRGLWMDQGDQFFPLNNRVVNVQEYGAKCDDSTDDAAAIQAAIDASVDGSGRGGTVQLPSGRVCRIGSTLSFYSKIGGVFDGNNATLRWVGNASDPAFLLQDVQFAVFKDFVLTTTTGTPLAAGIRSEGAGSGRISTHNKFENILMFSFGGEPLIGKGFQFALGAGGDGNNDANLFVKVTVRYYTIAAWSFEHSQSVGHTFINCSADANGHAGSIGVATSLGAGGHGGSFTWYGGSVNGNAVADFQIGGLTGSPLLISGVHSENSGRFFEMVAGASAGSKPVTIEGVEYEGDDLLNDGYAIILNGSGPFTITDTRFSGLATTTKIKLESSSPAALTLLNNNFDTLNSATQESIVDTVGAGPFRIIRTNNIYRNSIGGDATRADDVFSVANGGTGLGTITSGAILYGNGTSSLATSTSLMWDPANSRLGIGTTSPTAQLSTTGTVRFAGLGSGGANLVTDALGNVTASSDERLKDKQGNFTRGLDAISAIAPVMYRWRPATGLDTQSTYAGFFAQNVQTAIPEAVSQDSRGYLTLADRPILAALVNAIKEIATITGKFNEALVAWLGSASNNIGDLFADRVIGNQLCAKKTDSTIVCVTADQLATVLGGTTSGPLESPIGNSAPLTTPVVTLNGLAVSTISVGDVYLDLGARIVSPASDLNLGINVLLNGATTTSVAIDTSVPGQHTIVYTVTSPTTGLTGSATRTVIVSSSDNSDAVDNPFSFPANDNPPLQDDAVGI